MKKYLLLLCFGLLFSVGSAQAYNHVMAQDFLVTCRQADSIDVCRAYISGVIDDIFAFYTINSHQYLRAFTKNIRNWDAEKIRVAMLNWSKANARQIKNKTAAEMIDQFLYSAYIKPTASACGG